MNNTTSRFLLLLILLSQSGCATLITATACIATKSNDCGPAIGAAATVDAIVLEAAATSSCRQWVCDEYDNCFCDD